MSYRRPLVLLAPDFKSKIIAAAGSQASFYQGVVRRNNWFALLRRGSVQPATFERLAERYSKLCGLPLDEARAALAYPRNQSIARLFDRT